MYYNRVMHHIHLIHWFLDFLGIHNGEDQFSTRMYNFWSGFGANISLLALSGTIVGIYRHNLNRIEKLNPLHLVHKKEEKEES